MDTETCNTFCEAVRWLNKSKTKVLQHARQTK